MHSGHQPFSLARLSGVCVSRPERCLNIRDTGPLQQSYWEQIYEVAKRRWREKYSQLNHTTLLQCQIISLCKAYRTICFSLEPARTALSFAAFFFLGVKSTRKGIKEETKKRSIYVTLELDEILMSSFMLLSFLPKSTRRTKPREWEVVRLLLRGIEECLGCLQAIRATSNLS